MHVGTFLKDSDHFYNVPSGGPIYGPEKCLKEFKIANFGQKYLKSAEIKSSTITFSTFPMILQINEKNETFFSRSL